MKASYALLAVTNLLLLSLTALFGFIVDGESGWPRHFLLGILSSLFTCFVHVVFFTYFVVQEKIVATAIRHHELAASHHPRVQSYKLRAMLLSLAGIASVVITSSLGAAVGILVDSEVHMIAAIATIVLSAGLFYAQYCVAHEYRAFFGDVFGE